MAQMFNQHTKDMEEQGIIKADTEAISWIGWVQVEEESRRKE